MKNFTASLLRLLPMILITGIFIGWTMNLFAQNSDPRMWSIHFPKEGHFYDAPPGNLKYKNPNHKTRLFHLTNENATVSPNFRVHPSNFSQSEVPITRGLNPDILFGSANTFNSSAYFFSEGVYVSTNGGNTWFGSDTCKAAPISDHGGDPGPGVGPDGRLYMSYLPGSYNSIKAAYSTNYGSNWSTGVVLQSGSMDKNHTAVDNVSGSSYLGRAYVTWSDFTQSNPPISVSYSSNGGASWSTYQHISNPDGNHYSQGCNGAVGPGGVVYVAWAEPNNSTVIEDYVGLAKSTNGGATWTTNENIYDENGIRGNLTFTGSSSIRVNGFPWMAVDNSGGPRNGWIYIVTAEKNLAPAGNDPDIVMHISTNGGTNWSAGIRVNQDAINNGQYQYMPAVCVGDDGAVNVVYYDTRNAILSSGHPDSAQVYISRSTDGGATFEDVLVSDHSFKPKPISGLASGYQGDYIGIVESNGTVYPYWCDDITGIYQAWTAQVTFEAPCGVAAASNPNPPSGTTNVDINLSQLTWNNGTGAVTNELYFGSNPASLNLVQSGSLASSWSITPGYLPLNYYTTYYWKVVEIGTTCSTSVTFSFKTIQNPNFHMVTDTLYPQSANYWTGYTQGTTKTNGEINTVDPNVGWAAFDISSIPVYATITGVTLYGYINAISYPYWSVTPMGSVNPVTASASVINTQIQNNYGSGNAYFYWNGQMTSTGWWNSPLENNALSDLQNALTLGWFAVGFIDWDFTSTYYINFDGWNQSNPPYLVVEYEYSQADDPTGVSATAISNSQIDIAFTPNMSNNNVVVVWNQTGIFNAPTGTPPSPGQPFAGGTLLYNGIISPVHHTGLSSLTSYYYKLFSYDGASYSQGIAVNAQTLLPLDFAVDFIITDNCGNNTHPLVFGTAPGATDCFDPGFDLSAPPPPPAGILDARFNSCSDAFFTDIRATNTNSETIWNLQYQPGDGCNPVSFSWDPGELPPDGYFHLVDPVLGNLVNVNMRTTNSYSDIVGLSYLQIKYNYQIQSVFHENQGWNMLSLPVDAANQYYLALFPGAVPGTLYGYSGSYITKDTLENGNGYWLKFPVSGSESVYGSDRTECVINLNAGWNMIGGPNCNVPLSSVIDPGGIIIPGTLYGYSGSYVSATSIDGTKGYWIKAGSSGTITVSCGTPHPAGENNFANSLAPLTDFVKVDIGDAGQHSQTLYFNGKLNDNTSIESFSLPPIPPQGGFDARLTNDYKLSENDEVAIRIQSPEFPLSLKVTNPGSKAVSGYVLQEIANGVVVESHTIVDKEEVVISNANISLLKISKQESLPTTYNLAQNYPNPFNPSTTIEFSLPENVNNVNLTIYNILGEKITELVNTSLEAGRYSYKWDAKNAATGLYIYELRTEKFVSIKKMLLLK